MVKLTAAQKRLLTTAEASRVAAALKPHNDAVVLVKDIRAFRALRQKQRDALGKQVRAVKKGVKAPVRQTNLHERTRQKEAIFATVLSDLEARLDKLKAVVASEKASKKTSKKASTTTSAGALAEARRLLAEALSVVKADAESLRASHTLNGQLVDEFNGQITKELDGLEGLANRIQQFLKKK